MASVNIWCANNSLFSVPLFDLIAIINLKYAPFGQAKRELFCGPYHKPHVRPPVPKQLIKRSFDFPQKFIADYRMKKWKASNIIPIVILLVNERPRARDKWNISISIIFIRWALPFHNTCIFFIYFIYFRCRLYGFKIHSLAYQIQLQAAGNFKIPLRAVNVCYPFLFVIYHFDCMHPILTSTDVSDRTISLQ